MGVRVTVRECDSACTRRSYPILECILSALLSLLSTYRFRFSHHLDIRDLWWHGFKPIYNDQQRHEDSGPPDRYCDVDCRWPTGGVATIHSCAV